MSDPAREAAERLWLSIDAWLDTLVSPYEAEVKARIEEIIRTAHADLYADKRRLDAIESIPLDVTQEWGDIGDGENARYWLIEPMDYKSPRVQSRGSLRAAIDAAQRDGEGES